ncbi:MAG: response regulator receiver protein [Myxococcales bacterium]|nr:response regulator receiver protein [Myxococcales bacterium]
MLNHEVVLKESRRRRPHRLAAGSAVLDRVDPIPVLLIDDDIDTHDLLSVLLAPGYTVTSACNGREALSILGSLQPALILLDLDMPIMNGLEFRDAQLRDEVLVKIPTIVMSGGWENRVLDPGICGLLRKPFRSSALFEIVRRYCVH